MVEEDAIDDEQVDSPTRGASIPLDSPIETEDGSRPSSVMSSVSQRGRKRRRPNGLVVTSQPKGIDFWTLVDQFFTARTRLDQFGTSWSTPRWTGHVHVLLVLVSLC